MIDTPVLYRKYRPYEFDQVIGQSHIIKLLRYHVEAGKIHNAYLFVGPRGTGKTTIARIFARKINGLDSKNPEEEHIDIIEIDAASNRGIDEIREIRQNANFLPTQLKYKVYVVDEVHMLTRDAFNALLKTLEEPPKHIVFIFATTEPHKLPATILSRVIRLDFKLGTSDELAQRIRYISESEKLKIDDGGINKIVHFAKGSFRDAESLLTKVIRKAGKKITTNEIDEILGVVDEQLIHEFFENLHQANVPGVMKLIDQIELSGKDLTNFVVQCLERIVDELRNNVTEKIHKYPLKFLGNCARELNDFVQNGQNCLDVKLALELSCMAIIGDDLGTIPKTKTGNQDNDSKMRDTNYVSDIEVSYKNESIIKTKKTTASVLDKIDETATHVGSVSTQWDKSTITIEYVHSKWAEILQMSRAYNHHLAAFLSKSKLDSIEDSTLVLSVPFDFHRKKLEDALVRKKLLELFRQILARENIDYRVIVREKEQSDDMVDSEDDVEKNSNKQLVENIFGKN